MANVMQSDRGFVSGFIGVGIHMRIQHILQHIHIASRCKEELGKLKDLVMRIELIIMHIQQDRHAFKTNNKASAVNEWLTKLDGNLLLQSSIMVQRCSIPKSCVNFSGRQTKKKINCLIKDIAEQLKLSPLLVRIPDCQAGDTQKAIEGLGQYRDSVETLASCATTSQAAMKELIVGQDDVLPHLKKLVIADADANFIGVLGKPGSGKTLILKTLFNSQEVCNHFSDGLLLWLTVSHNPSISSLLKALRPQIERASKNENLGETKEEEVNTWLNRTLQKSSKFVLFLDDVWEGNAGNLFTELGIVDVVSDRTKSKVIVSSRNRSALLKMKIENKYIITIEDLMDFRERKNLKDAEYKKTTQHLTEDTQNLTEDTSWQWFKHYAFSDNSGNPPENIKEMAEHLCKECKGVPLGIKVVGRAMARSAHLQQWKWALDRLENGDSLDNCLRLSYDALGKEDFNLQLCFLHVAAAFLPDEIIDIQEVIPLWMGEGLLARKMLQNVPPYILADHFLIEPMITNTEGRPVCLRMQDPYKIGRLYVDLLAERCLIEPMVKDADGLVVCFRMLKVVRDWVTGIAENEENFYSHVEEGLTALPRNEPPARKHIFLSRNKFSSLPQFPSSSEIQSLSISQNTELKKIPKNVIGGLKSLKVLDLSGTSAHSLPESVGCLEQLICLKLSGMPIKKLPKSLRDLGRLEILDLSFTNIKGLPSDIHMLRSLRYLGLRGCEDLLNLPHDIWGLISLQYLYMNGCSKWPKPASTRHKKVNSLQSLGDLIQLKQLALQNNVEEKFTEVTLGSMTEMDTLLLILPKLKSVPRDIENMSKLSYLKFYECSMLEEIQHLQELQNLRQLEIILCPKVKNIPKEFGEEKAFPSLKIFCLVGLDSLEEMPAKENDAMPCLQRFDIMSCPKLRTSPQSYLNMETKIRVYCCPSMEDIRVDGIEVISMSYMDTDEIINRYLHERQKKENRLRSELSSDELFQFVKQLVINS